jgi:hypothetical protein
MGKRVSGSSPEEGFTAAFYSGLGGAGRWRRTVAPGATLSAPAEPFLGMGFGDSFEVSQGDSGLLEGGVRLANETR